MFNYRTSLALPAARLLGGGGHEVKAACNPSFVAGGTQGWRSEAGFLLLLLSSWGIFGSASPADLMA